MLGIDYCDKALPLDPLFVQRLVLHFVWLLSHWKPF